MIIDKVVDYLLGRFGYKPQVNIDDLRPGDQHYRAYVGPPLQYDIMGATQFRLLTTLGLRDFHRVLDIGCGSLRLGKLLIPYLQKGNYFGVEPNKWLIKDSIKYELGESIIRLKKPTFSNNDIFNLCDFNTSFDYIVLQSIFSHCGIDLIVSCLAECKKVTDEKSLILATFIHGQDDFTGKGWVYPECVEYRPSSIASLIAEAGFTALHLPWYHPRQSWYLIADKKILSEAEKYRKELSGSVLFCDQFAGSLNTKK